MSLGECPTEALSKEDERRPEKNVIAKKAGKSNKRTVPVLYQDSNTYEVVCAGTGH